MQNIELDLNSEVSTLKSLDNDLLFVSTKSNEIKILSITRLELLQNITHKYIDEKTKFLSISSDAKLFSFLNNQKIYILSTQNLKILNSIQMDDEIINISFDSTNTYLFFATTKNKIYQYRYNARTSLANLTSNSHIDNFYIYQNKLLVTGKNIYIYDINTHIRDKILLDLKSSTSCAIFLDESNICFGDKSGYIFFYSLKTLKTLKKISTPFEQITQLIPIQNSRYIIVNGNETSTILIDYKIKKIISYKYLNFKEKITSIQKYENNKLLVLFSDNKLVSIELSNPKELTILVKNNQIKEAYELIKNNLILEDTQEYQELEKIYKEAYKEATLALINKNKFLAKKILTIYENLESKKEEIANLFKSFGKYVYLKELYHEHKTTLCYALIDKYPALKMTPEYKKLEDKYRQTLLNAQYYISSNQDIQAKEILQEYMIINSKRNIVKLLLNSKILKSINNIQNYNILNKTISKLDLDTLKFYNAYHNGNFNLCYAILDKNANLNDLEISNILNKHYNKIIYKCDEYALKGDIKSVKKELGELIHINTRKEKIGSLLKVSFHVKIKLLLNYQTLKEAENMIYSYLDIFGIDDDIINIMHNYETITSTKLAITQEQNIQKSKFAWYENGYFN